MSCTSFFAHLFDTTGCQKVLTLCGAQSSPEAKKVATTPWPGHFRPAMPGSDFNVWCVFVVLLSRVPAIRSWRGLSPPWAGRRDKPPHYPLEEHGPEYQAWRDFGVSRRPGIGTDLDQGSGRVPGPACVEPVSQQHGSCHTEEQRENVERALRSEAIQGPASSGQGKEQVAHAAGALLQNIHPEMEARSQPQVPRRLPPGLSAERRSRRSRPGEGGE